MEHIKLSVISVGSKEFILGGACSDGTPIHSTQDISNIDIRGMVIEKILFSVWRFVLKCKESDTGGIAIKAPH